MFKRQISIDLWCTNRSIHDPLGRGKVTEYGMSHVIQSSKNFKIALIIVSFGSYNKCDKYYVRDCIKSFLINTNSTL